MDPARFDSLTRVLISRIGPWPTRRSVLRAVGGGLFALALKSAPDARGKGNQKRKQRKKQRKICKKKFGPGKGTFCRGSAGTGCFDLLTDPAHCGGCATACAAGQTCLGGQCTTPGCESDADCGHNTRCQSGSCVALANHCPTAFTCTGFGGEPPNCGSVLGGEPGTCGCYRSTEGNHVCVSLVDAFEEGFPEFDYHDLLACNTSQECKASQGPRWYCRAVAMTSNGLTCGSTVGRCWPVCDNPTSPLQ